MAIRIKSVSLLFMILSMLSIIFLCFYKKTFWYDEAYSIGMINFSFKEIWNITAHDVHPPLYYIMLKIFTTLLGKSLFVMHLFSVIGVGCTLLLGLFPIRKLWGSTTSYIFVLLISILPVTLFYGIEIRMYSWLMFFVLATAIYAYKSYTSPTCKSYYIITTLFAICAAYTHNYGLVSALSIYLLLWIMFIVKKKSTKYLLVSSIVFIILFSFWIPNLYYQITSVKESYWIKSLKLKNIAYFLLYFTSAKLEGIVIKAIHIIMFLITILFLYIAIKSRKKINKEHVFSASFFMAIYLIVFLSTLIFSIVISPILIDRYLMSVMGCLILSISIFISDVNYTSPKAIRILGLMMLICLIPIYISMFVEIVKKDKLSDSQNRGIILYIEKEIEKNKENCTVVSFYEKMLNPILSILNPEYTYQYYYVESEKTVDWTTSPFKMQKIHSLKNNSNTIILIKDLSEINSIYKKYPKLLNHISKDIEDYYLVSKTDTIANVEIQILTKK